MQHYSIPACYFPSTVLFIDDSRDFLLNFVLQLDEGLAYRMFDSPFEALDCIHNKIGELEMFHQDDLHGSQIVLPNSSIIHREIYNPRRFEEISVVIVDYAMPGIDGIEFCRKINDTNIKKILLTGKADEKTAIDAFNEGLIDRFIQKNDPYVAELITKSIDELQIHYFQAISEKITQLLSVPVPNCLYDKKFAEFFRQLCQNKRIVEYYLADNSGSFLLLDDDANVSFLMVRNQEDLTLSVNLAREKGASADILQQIAAGEKIPCLSLADLNANSIDWSTSLAAANSLMADRRYFYAYMHGPALFDVQQDKILSYHRHLEEVDAEELLML